MKTGNIKGTFSPQMGTLKDNSARDLVDTEEIKKKWKEYMEELYVKDPNEPDFMMVWSVTLESPLETKEIQPVHPKINQSWIHIGRTGVEPETSTFWPLDAKS